MELTGIKQNLRKISSFSNWRPGGISHLISHEFHPYSLMPSPLGIRSEVHQLVEALGLFVRALQYGSFSLNNWTQNPFHLLANVFPTALWRMISQFRHDAASQNICLTRWYFTVLCSKEQHATINLLEIQNFCVVSCLNPTNTESRIWRLLNFHIKWLSKSEVFQA